MSYFIYLENILNDKSQYMGEYCGNGLYQKVITIDRIPTGALASYIQQKSFPNISTFKRHCGHSCKNIILNENGDRFLTETDLPQFISFVASNGYKIDSVVNKLITKNKVCSTTDKQFIFAFYE